MEDKKKVMFLIWVFTDCLCAGVRRAFLHPSCQAYFDFYWLEFDKRLVWHKFLPLSHILMSMFLLGLYVAASKCIWHWSRKIDVRSQTNRLISFAHSELFICCDSKIQETHQSLRSLPVVYYVIRLLCIWCIWNFVHEAEKIYGVRSLLLSYLILEIWSFSGSIPTLGLPYVVELYAWIAWNVDICLAKLRVWR